MSVSPEKSEDSSLEARAHRLWEAAVEAARSANVPITKNTQYGDGYMLKGDLLDIAVKLWPNLSSKGKRNSAARSFVSGLYQHLRSNGNAVRIRDSHFIRAVYVQRAGRVTQHPILGTLTDKPPEITILERSKAVWQRARNYCAREPRPIRHVEGVTFWECDKPLMYFIKQVYPDLTAYEGGRQPIYDFLRSTANGVNVGGKQDDELVGTAIHSWLIRDEWNEGGGEKVFITLNREPTARDRREARLSAHEAGEDREPMPVVITKATQEAVNDMTESASAAVPEPEPEPTPEPEVGETGYTVNTSEEECPYPGCRRRFAAPHNLARHMTTKHKDDKDGSVARKTALNVVADTISALAARDEEVARLKAQLAELETELRTTKAALEKATTEGDDTARVDLIREVLKRVDTGEVKPFRAFAEIEDLLE